MWFIMFVYPVVMFVSSKGNRDIRGNIDIWGNGDIGYIGCNVGSGDLQLMLYYSAGQKASSKISTKQNC